MTNYQKGSAYEREFAKRMTRKGYAAIRSAGSHGFADVVLIPKPDAEPLNVLDCGCEVSITPQIFLCQLKRGNISSPQERYEFSKQVFYHSSISLLWVSKKDREKEIIELL